jgi:SAM-dependent methyltransferase
VTAQPFEEVELPEASFDLGLAATSFHWIDQAAGLNKVGRLLKPGGVWAMWWNVFGDPERQDHFHEATRELLQSLAVSPSGASNTIPFALDTAARRRDIAAYSPLSLVHVEVIRWSITLNAEQVRRLYATFSQFQLLPPVEREALLDRLADVAATQFDNAVERNMTTPVYIAKRLV